MTETLYPDTAGAMAELIDTTADPDGGYQRSVDVARADHDTALANLEEARRALREHEIAPPDADPHGWAARKRELAEVIPVLERLANQRKEWLQTALRNQASVRRSVAQEIEHALHKASQRAYADAYQQKMRLIEQVRKLERGDYPAVREAGKRKTALRVALESFSIYE